MVISSKTKEMLWMRSGGYCQNPGCHNDFIVFFQDGTLSSIDELAHIIGKSNNGPRGESNMDTVERDEYDNIILLCPICHTLIDKSTKQFPVEMLLNWKQQHEEAIRSLFQVPVYSNRKLLSKDVHRLLRFNKAIFHKYGPYSSYSNNPLSGASITWRKHILSDIIPNNRKVANLLKANEELLTDKEKETYYEFVLHQQAFEYNHISGDKNEVAPLFPEEMNDILQG